MTEFNYTLATPIERLLARIIDTIISLCIFVLEGIIVRLLFMTFLKNNTNNIVNDVIIGLCIFIPIFYLFCSDGLKNGQSYGKRVMKIRVIDATSGKPCNFRKSFVRHISTTFLGLLDIIFMASKKKQRLGDMMVNTIVVHKTPRSPIY